MKNKYIFTTKYLGEGFAFSNRFNLDNNSKIAEYLKKKIWDTDNLWRLYRENKDKMGSFFRQKGISFYKNLDKTDFLTELKNNDFNEIINQFVEDNKLVVDENSLLSCVGEKSKDKFESRFSYYTLSSNGSTQDHNVFAIPHLSWESDNKWIQCLIEEESFTKELGKDDTLYLILHDKDVPGYEHSPLDILPKPKNISSSFNVVVIVFQHTSNDIVDILTNQIITEVDVSNRIVSMIETKKKLKEDLFKPNVKEKGFDERKSVLNSIKPDSSLDLIDENILIDKSNLSYEIPEFESKNIQLPNSNSTIYIYSDTNGAILNELFHVNLSIPSAKRISKFNKLLRNPGIKGLVDKDIHKFTFPLIIKIYKSFFDDWENSVDNDEDKLKIHNHRNKKAMNENLQRIFSFFNNSSIFVRLVDIFDKEAEEKAIEDFKYFDEIGLYQYDSAWENLEYQTRLFTENYLSPIYLNGHYRYVTPELYGDETKHYQIVYEDNDGQSNFMLLDSFHDLALRILIVDDKIGLKDKNEIIECSTESFEKLNNGLKIDVKKCGECKGFDCKLRTIKQLMEFKPTEEDTSKGYYNYWNQESIKSYYCSTTILDFLGDGNLDLKKVSFPSDNKFLSDVDPTHPKVQLVGVRDVRTALLLLSKFKFDMVFFDYLLHKKDKGSAERDYANQFFNFLSNKHLSKTLFDLRRFVLYNRGPLDKLWIMPITGFNQTFINDLYRNNINLIDNKWNISNGADPITTPWQFLYHLNRFIELQLKSNVFSKKKLMTFLQYTCEDLEAFIKDSIDNYQAVNCFDKFQQFMGAEYSEFVKRYGSRKLIQRDAILKNEDNSNKSMFATYVSNEFYNKDTYYIEIELNRLMHIFYHLAATMFNDREGYLQLRESFVQLRIFIAYNELENSGDSKEKIINGLQFLQTVIDSHFII